MEQREVILKAGLEGGSITLWGRKNALQQWTYAVGTNESAMADFLSEEDADLIPTLVKEPGPWIASFAQSMTSLERYPWRRATPFHVHPDFRQMVWKQVMANRPPLRNLVQWGEACDVEIEVNVVRLAEWILDSKSTVILSGAGISTASGVPDFRSPSGWWNNIDPTTVATSDALKDNYQTFRAFYSHRIHALNGLQPNEGHRVIAKWEREGLVEAVATQNVDGFHQMAGSKNVYELHGSIRSAHCATCDSPVALESFLAENTCEKCGGKLRPDVTLFGEHLPAQAWDDALDAIAQCELVIVVGSSLNVYPANSLPSMTAGRTAVINLEPTGMDEQFDLVIHGKAVEVLREVDKWMINDNCVQNIKG